MEAVASTLPSQKKFDLTNFCKVGGEISIAKTSPFKHWMIICSSCNIGFYASTEDFTYGQCALDCGMCMGFVDENMNLAIHTITPSTILCST